MSISINTTNYEFRKLEINSQTVTRIRAPIVKTRERPHLGLRPPSLTLLTGLTNPSYPLT